jgi:hypothetical protein
MRKYQEPVVSCARFVYIAVAAAINLVGQRLSGQAVTNPHDPNAAFLAKSGYAP